MPKRLIATCCFLVAVASQPTAHAHDVPGQPSHVLSDDPDAPPALQMEAETGQYQVTFIALPAAPEPEEPGAVNLYLSRIDDGQPFLGEVTFKVRSDSLFSGGEETIGTQTIHGDHHSQEFVFAEAGDYIIRAEFEANDELHAVDLPITVGTPSSLGTIVVVAAALLIALVSVNLVQRRRLRQVQSPQRLVDEK